MHEDIMAEVRKQILKEDESLIPWVPHNLEQTWVMQAGLAGAIAVFLAGFSFGAHMGLAGPWGAIAGTIPCAIVGATIGYFAGAKAGSKFQHPSQFSSKPSSGTSTYRIKGNETKVITSVDQCLKCGASKATWWDSFNNRCVNCGASEKVT
jgi:hypothetical protein